MSVVPYVFKTPFKRPLLKSTFAGKAKRQMTGEGTGQMVPMEVDAKTGHKGASATTISRRSSRSKYYYDKWALNDTRTDPNYPRPEVKEWDVNIGTLSFPFSIANVGAFTTLAFIDRGFLQDERVGGVIAIKSVYYQFVVNLGTVVPSVPNAIRHMVVYDRQSNQANPVTIGTLLADSTNPLTSPLNIANQSRFVVIADDRTTLSPNGDMIRIIKNFYRINLSAFYGDGNNEPVSGNVFVFLVSDRPNDTSAPTIYGTWRLRYIDN